MNEQILREIRRFLSEDGELLVVTHFSPDGDAIGSILAFGGMLDQLNVRHILAVDDKCPLKYSVMPGYESIRDLKSDPLTETFSHIVVLDAGALPRIGSANDCVSDETKILNIDHHFTGSYYGDINLIEVDAASTTEIVYDLCNALEVKMTDQICYGIFVGLVTDTGRFRFSNTNSRSLSICGEMVEHGVDSGRVMENIYYNRPYEMMVALGEAIRSLRQFHNGKFCILGLDNGNYNGDTEGFVEYAASVKGVVVSVFYCQINNDYFKVSLRSRCDIDVSEIAKRFGGGGHRKAAGFRFDGKSDGLRSLLIDEVGKELTAHGHC